MKITLTKLAVIRGESERHRLAIVRDDASTESVELETRSLLLHDLVHYAVEAEAKIEDGFWGLLASGTTLEQLADRTMSSMSNPISPGIVLAERLVGPMQSVWNERFDAAMYVEQARLPWVTMDFVDAVRRRLRALTGHWRATKFRDAMEIHWPPEARTMPG